MLTRGIDRNTTLPHPEAIVGPGACIEDLNIVMERRQSKRSFGRHMKTTSSGKIPLAERGMHVETGSMASLNGIMSMPSTIPFDSRNI